MACEIGSKRLIDINKTQSGRFMMVSDRPTAASQKSENLSFNVRGNLPDAA